MSISCKGYTYYSDANSPVWEKSFPDLESLKRFLTNELPYGKEGLELPSLKDGKLCVPGSMSAEIRFKVSDSFNRPAVYTQVSLIKEGDVILFSSGHYTGGEGHIGKRAAVLLDELQAFKESKYNFGD